MNQATVADRRISHIFLNHLYSGFQGRFVFLTILSQLKHPSLNPDELPRSRDLVAEVSNWIEDFKRGSILIQDQWQEPQSAESRLAVEYLADLRREIFDTAAKISALITQEGFQHRRRDLAYLTAALGRVTYSRENFWRVRTEFAKETGETMVPSDYQRVLPLLEEDIALSHEFLDAVQATEQIDPTLFGKVLEKLLLLPGIYRSVVHDLAQVLSRFHGGLTFELADVGRDEASRWHQLGFTPVDAGYWKAFSVLPDDAAYWRKAGITQPEVAAEWLIYKFDPYTAGLWFKEGIPASVARLWAAVNFSPKETCDTLAAGITDPTVAARKRHAEWEEERAKDMKLEKRVSAEVDSKKDEWD